jgi:peptidoglycan-associated lipoprotein
MLKKASISLLALFALTACSTGYNKKMSSAKDECGTHQGKHVGDIVYFDYNSSALSHHAKESLTKQAHWLKEHHNPHVVVEGHADERGTEEYNLALGERRAHEVRNFLVRLGVEHSKVEMVSYGKERPAVQGHDEAAFAKNRRAVTIAK